VKKFSKIGPHLPKLWSKVKCIVFFSGTKCSNAKCRKAIYSNFISYTIVQKQNN